MPARIKGLNKLIKDLKKLGKEGEKRISETTELNAKELEKKAKLNSDKAFNFGYLESNILALPTDEKRLTWTIKTNAFGNAPYSAYVEFGTGGKVDVPEEMKDVAIQFLGAGIRQVNLRARPYLYPAFIEQKSEYIKDLKEDLKELAKKL